MNSHRLCSLLASIIIQAVIISQLLISLVYSTGSGFFPAMRVSVVKLDFEETSAVGLYPKEKMQNFFQEKNSPEITPEFSSPYVPAHLLTERPVTVQDINTELSARFWGVAAQSFRLVLLINEYGDVDQVVFDNLPLASDLPEVLKADVIQRFFLARFLPGRLHGEVVRSALRIEVSLQN